MKLLVTGTPSVGKTTIAKTLAKALRLKYLNEKEFALRCGIGKWDVATNELEVPLKPLEKELNKLLKKEKKIVIEGHMLCETRLDVDAVILLRLDPEILQMRLERLGYSDEKIMDNVFCEGIDYCRKHLMRRYKSGKIIEINNKRSLKETKQAIIKELAKKGLL